jgi:hypothetical protein
MTRQTIILALIFLLATSFCGQHKDDLYLNYVAAIKNESTSQYYLVVKVKNLNNGLTREYCTKGDFLKGALHQECKLDYDNKGVSKVYSLAVDNKDRYFEFKNDSAIWNIIGDWEYSIDDLDKMEKKINFDSLAIQIRKTGKWSMEIFDDKTMLLYAHALFNRGVLTGEDDCFGGTLVYVDRNKIND